MALSGIRYRREGIPDPKPDSLLVIISNVNGAALNIVLGGSHMLRDNNDYALNAIFRPLRSIKDLMKAFMAHVDRHCYSAMLLARVRPEMAQIYRDKTLKADKKYPKILRYLKSIDSIDEYSYDLLDRLSKDLDPVVEALDTLAKFLQTICSEGNCLSIEAFDHSASTNSSVTLASDEDASQTSPTLGFPWPSPSSSNLSLVEARSPQFVSPPHTNSSIIDTRPHAPAPHLVTPSWKISLSNRFPVEDLSVTFAGVQVFGKALGKILAAKKTVVAAINLCNSRGELTKAMLPVLASWNHRFEEWAGQNNEYREEKWEDYTEDMPINPGLPENVNLL